MITPSFSLTATERVLPRLALDWTTGLAQPGVDVVRAGVATFVGSNGFIQSATANTQRIDYSTGTSGLLVEESRTNFNLYSEDYSNLAWSKSAVNVSTNVATAPNNTVTADKLIPTATTDLHRILQTTELSGSTGAMSVFVRASGYTNIAIRDSFSTGQFAAFNLSNGTIFSGSTATSPTIKNMGDGWFRCSIVVTGATTQALGVNILAPSYSGGSPNATWLANGTDGVELWGTQTEAGAFATSYIPTEASAVTRNADVATITGTDFSDFYNAIEGSIVVQVLPSTINGTRPAVQFDDNTADELIALRGLAADPQLFVVDGGVTQATLDAGTIAANTLYKLGGAWKDASYAVALNGAAPVTQASGTFPTATQARLGSDGTNYLNGHLQSLRFWSQRLTNAEVQAFSK